MRAPPATRPRRPTHREAMAEWSARNHGYGWEHVTKPRYWASRWTRKRCFWCRRAKASTGRRWTTSRHFELNHLTYIFSKPGAGPLVVMLRVLFGLRYADTGQVPLWAVRAMCKTCHDIETRLTRKYDPGHRRPWAHGIVTLGVRWASTWVLLLVLWLAAVWLGLWGAIA